MVRDDFVTTTENQLSASKFEFLVVQKDIAPEVGGFKMKGLLGLSTSPLPTKTFSS